MNFHAYTSGTGGGAIFQASILSNQALARRDGGDYAGAEQLYKQVLEIKINAGGSKSVHAAISYNALGETQLELGKLEQAEENLSRAVEIRENDGQGSAFDAAVSRENLARVYEVKGLWDQARQVRTKNFSQMVCSHYKCPGQMYNWQQLRQCSKCKAAYYCSENCQRADWRPRHKKYCKAFEDQ
ncbi:hypothetical protein FRC04_002148 [Tulasnella sp. 424]|nr:hypothetical protein FRC04_002148 [Tulasnella sp. 424]KAG8967790.1 hypothetical protein FRC05_001886 [Tulasnella sp. 425]